MITANHIVSEGLHICRVYLGVKTCEVFLCLVAIVMIRVYNVDYFIFFVLHHW